MTDIEDSWMTSGERNAKEDRRGVTETRDHRQLQGHQHTAICRMP